MSKKVVVITGASSGIGRSCADHLDNLGWTVVGASRRGVSGESWHGMSMDVDSDESVREGIAAVMSGHGRIDALVACAGWGLGGASEQTPTSEAQAQMETNFWGAVRAVNASLPAMRAQGGGRVVLISSISGVIGIPFQSFYSASKFALEGYGEALAYEVEPFNVHVTLVEPGNFRTGFTASRRMVSTPLDDAYVAARHRAITAMERDEEHGAPPFNVAKAVERVLTRKKPPRRVSVGKYDERVGLVAKRVLPFGVFERAARGSLGV